jgi:hypothetical protein
MTAQPYEVTLSPASGYFRHKGSGGDRIGMMAAEEVHAL